MDFIVNGIVWGGVSPKIPIFAQNTRVRFRAPTLPIIYRRTAKENHRACLQAAARVLK
jgi:hypothetical protein